ncbi:hypothetical protein BH24ACI2_BH24ACI2_02200 [soil metagenome]|jgi:Asp-tRNA(Asn)/Glu-tRNA(Gln) amidotransferase A subunit family amidase|nr:hypothetical protein [Acidobacteriota bacterium]
MIFKLFQLIFVIFLFAAAVVCVNGQINLPDASTSSGRPNQSKEDVPKNVKESLAKNRIDREKRDYEELIERGEEAAKLSAELGSSFDKQNTFSAEDWKKIDRLEKLVKRIRKELGGDDSDSDEIITPTMPTAVKTLQEKTTFLLDELKKCTPYSISVVAIENSNALLKIVSFIQNGKN